MQFDEYQYILYLKALIYYNFLRKIRLIDGYAC